MRLRGLKVSEFFVLLSADFRVRCPEPEDDRVMAATILAEGYNTGTARGDAERRPSLPGAHLLTLLLISP